eukprot:TRINITY_DN10856_c0_g1_i1.p1 TRINITY_DN10856_c0_g1~~TRINITY_DN10856_c0_g1_i1.p1  ORF type:complete len:607 (+),score=108.03 TRINITY_DN10856_c0_g1_i1:28-1848(+)
MGVVVSALTEFEMGWLCKVLVKRYFLILIGICCLLYIIIRVINIIREKLTERKWAAVAEKKKNIRDSLLKEPSPEVRLLPELQDKVLNATLSQLTDMLNNGAVTSEDLVALFYRQASTLGVELGLVTDFRLEDALKEARRCDVERGISKDKSKLPPLFGIPISIKDNIIIGGCDTTCGFASQCFKQHKEDGLIVELYKKAGAIPFVRGNVPQGLFTIESNNHVWGRAKNWYDRERTVGGSSGGEAGLVSIKATPLAIGNDLGGSLRAPALFCGTYSFKPGSKRGTTLGTTYWNSTGKFANLAVLPTTGPLARCVDDVVLGTKILLSKAASDRDPLIYPVPWREQEYLNATRARLRVGYLDTHPLLPVSRANRRAVNEVVNLLKSKGHEVVPFSIPNLEEITSTFFALVTAEGELRYLKEGLQGERLIDEYQLTYFLTHLPLWLSGLVTKLLLWKGEVRLGKVSEWTQKKTAAEYFTWYQKSLLEREKFLEHWQANKIDVMILPGLATPAFRHGQSSSLVLTTLYASIFNVIDFPVGAVPVTTVKHGEDVYNNEDTNFTDRIFTDMVECLRGSVGMPIGVQVCTLPWEDEKCLGIMKQIEQYMKTDL